MTLNQQWRLARQPIEGWPTDGDFVLNNAEIPVPGANQALTRTLYLSLDPYQWGRRRSGIEQIGDVCHGRTVEDSNFKAHLLRISKVPQLGFF